MVEALTDQPQLCELTSIVSPVLERKISVDAILAAKHTLADLSIRVAQLLHGRLPSIPLADCAWVGGTVMIYVAGILAGRQRQPARARGARSSGVCRDAARVRAGPRAISRSVVPGSFEKADRAGRPRPAAGPAAQPAAEPVAVGIPSLSAREEASEV